MSHRDLPVAEFIRRVGKFGWRAEVSRQNFLKVFRPGSAIGWQQHLHRGIHDILRRHRVRDALRRLGIPPEEFYR